MEHNPRVVFERMFGDGGSTDMRSRVARLQKNRSILDSVGDKVSLLKTSLGSTVSPFGPANTTPNAAFDDLPSSSAAFRPSVRCGATFGARAPGKHAVTETRRAMARALFDRLRSGRDFVRIAATEITIETRRKRARVAADGEVVKLRTPLRYRARPGALRVLAPRREETP